jgi:hypothetical protein
VQKKPTKPMWKDALCLKKSMPNLLETNNVASTKYTQDIGLLE